MQENILLFFKNAATPFLDQIAELITMLGEQYVFILIISYFYWNISKRKGFKLAVAFLYSSLLNALLKLAFHAPRPFEKLDFIKGKRVETATGYSFPSGHTQGSTTFFITLSRIIKKKRFTVPALLVILAIGVSRVYLGVHWPVDVIGGWVFGIILAYLFCAIVDRYYDEPEKLKLIFFRIQGGVLLFSAALLLFDLFHLHGSMKIEDFFKLSGISSGAVYGFFFEMKFIQFSPSEGGRAVRILRFILGLAVSVALMSGVKMILPGHYIADFFRYALVGLWITFLWPAAGLKLKLFSAEDPSL
ncbi:MAG: phosphatase PAP2 family protein [Spirochaetales bacterium]|nr:phosphatase PAP2 family protein [Spirochaetales bacterium]